MNIRQLSPELEKRAQDNLGERPDHLQDDIKVLRSWLKKQPHLISRDDDQFLLSFLRACKYRMEDTKRRLEAFLTCKTYYPELFKTRPVEQNVLDIVQSGFSYVLPKPHPTTGSRIIVSEFALFDPQKFKLRDYFIVNSMIFELLAFEDDVTSINGLEQVIDLKNCTFQQTLHLNPMDLKKLYTYLDQCIPLRIRRVHVINLRRELHGIYKLAQTVLPSETSFEIVMHEQEEDLYKLVPREFLHDEYGGSNGNKVDLTKELVNSFQNHKDYFEKDQIWGTDENLRLAPYSNLQTDFGVDGNFRKLEID